MIVKGPCIGLLSLNTGSSISSIMSREFPVASISISNSLILNTSFTISISITELCIISINIGNTNPRLSNIPGGRDSWMRLEKQIFRARVHSPSDAVSENNFSGA